MRYYQPNSVGGDGRYSTRGLMGPAVLVTLGLLFLLANMADYPFERTWPILLIVIGAIKVVRYVIPDSAPLAAGQYPPPPYSAATYPVSGEGTPPPNAPAAGALGEGKNENGEVHNG